MKGMGFAMRILVMSDSHRNTEAMLKAIARESPGLILHLGDHDADCAAIEMDYPEIPLRSVRGNCDRSSTGLDRDEFKFDGMLFFMTHGNLYSVKTGFSSIIETAKRRGAAVLLFGHTHVPYLSEGRTLTVVNPGSIGTGAKTYAVLDTRNGTVECEIKKV